MGRGFFKGWNSFKAQNGNITGTNTGVYSTGYLFGAGLAFGEASWGGGPNLTFDGNFSLVATASNKSNAIQAVSMATNTTMNFKNGNSSFHAQHYGNSGDAIYYTTAASQKNTFARVNVDNAHLTFSAKTNNGGAFVTTDPTRAGLNVGGISFSGNGSVDMSFENNSNNATFNPNMLNNSGLNGSLNITATNKGIGAGVAVLGLSNVSLKGANITGISNGGQGVSINAGQSGIKGLDLNGSNFNGITNTGSTGVQIVGGTSEVLITNGSLSGTSSSGNGRGISLIGPSNYVLDGTNVTGKSVNGVAVEVSGNLSLNNNTSIDGTASGTGTGVSVSGNLQSTGGVSITGNATSGSGIQVSGNTTLSNATVTGNASTGTGLNVSGNAQLTNASLSGTTETGTGSVVAGNLTADGTSSVTGNATRDGGAGVTLNGTVTGGQVDGHATSGDAVSVANGSVLNGTTVTGNAQDGAGIKTEGQVSIIGSVMNGKSVNGSDLDVSGTLSHDPDTTINAGVITGQENIQEVMPVTPPLVIPPSTAEDGSSEPSHNIDSGKNEPEGNDPSVPSESGHNQNHKITLRKLVDANSLIRSAVNAQVAHMNQPALDGFHSVGTPMIPVEKYEPAEHTVGINLCDGESCQSMVLDAGKPAEGSVKASDR
ncbi:hypothetical protein YT14_004671 [Salmonella enterica subsp. enterica serovar Oslo]|nr:hypothetical protein [Salmonella enterica subsp. enterica serovar Oslo]